MAFYKDDTKLKTAPLKPAKPITQLPDTNTVLGKIARAYNDVGGLIDTLAIATGIEPMAVLAVWYVESGARAFTPGKPVLRFENHKFWKYWGKTNAAKFDAHFRFGGHNAQGNSAQNHAFRNPISGSWRSFHGTQTGEYEVFDFACTLATKEAACLSCSFGGPQIMGFNHDACGYADATKLFTAFGADVRWQVLGFFDFVRMNGLVHDIKDKLWIEFGSLYNGDGATYGPLLAAAYGKKAAFDKLPR